MMFMFDFKSATVKHAMHPAVATTQHLLHITIDTHQRSASDIEISYSYAPIDELTTEIRDWISTKYDWASADDDVEKMTARDGFFTHDFYEDGDVDDESGNDFSEEFKRGRELAKKVFTSYYGPQIDKASLLVIETRFQDY